MPDSEEEDGAAKGPGAVISVTQDSGYGPTQAEPPTQPTQQGSPPIQPTQQGTPPIQPTQQGTPPTGLDDDGFVTQVLEGRDSEEASRARQTDGAAAILRAATFVPIFGAQPQFPPSPRTQSATPTPPPPRFAAPDSQGENLFLQKSPAVSPTQKFDNVQRQVRELEKRAREEEQQKTEEEMRAERESVARLQRDALMVAKANKELMGKIPLEAGLDTSKKRKKSDAPSTSGSKKRKPDLRFKPTGVKEDIQKKKKAEASGGGATSIKHQKALLAEKRKAKQAAQSSQDEGEEEDEEETEEEEAEESPAPRKSTLPPPNQRGMGAATKKMSAGPNKRKKTPPGKVAQREINRLRRSTELLIRKLPFQR